MLPGSLPTLAYHSSSCDLYGVVSAVLCLIAACVLSLVPKRRREQAVPEQKFPSFADGCLDLNGCSHPEANQSTGLRQDSKGSCAKVRMSSAGTDRCSASITLLGGRRDRVVLSRAVML